MQYDDETLAKLKNVELEILEKFIKVCDSNGINYFVVFGTAIGAERHNGFIPWDDDLDVAMLRDDYNKFVNIFEQMGEQYELITPVTEPKYACSVIHVQKKNTKFVSEDDEKCEFQNGINMDIFVYDPMSDDPKIKQKQLRKSWLYGRLIFLSGKGTPHVEGSGVKKALFKAIFAVAHFGLRVLGLTSKKLYEKLEDVAMSCENQDTEYLATFCSPWADRESIKKEYIFPLRDVKFEHLTVKAPARDDLVLTHTYGDYMQLPPVEQRVSHRPKYIDFGE